MGFLGVGKRGPGRGKYTSRETAMKRSKMLNRSRCKTQCVVIVGRKWPKGSESRDNFISPFQTKFTCLPFLLFPHAPMRSLVIFACLAIVFVSTQASFPAYVIQKEDLSQEVTREFSGTIFFAQATPSSVGPPKIIISSVDLSTGEVSNLTTVDFCTRLKLPSSFLSISLSIS